MQTRYFRQTGVDPSKVEEDVRVLQELSTDQFAALARFLGTGKHLISRDQTLGDELDTFLRDTGLWGEQYARARRLSHFLVEASEEFGDDPAALVDDLDSLVPLGSGVRVFLVDLTDAIARAVRARRRDRLAKRSGPALTGLSYTCDIRVDVADFDVFRDDPESRAAEPRSWLPVILMRFSTDEEDELRCQLDLEHLRRTISVLRAAEKDLLKVHESLRDVGLIEEGE